MTDASPRRRPVRLRHLVHVGRYRHASLQAVLPQPHLVHAGRHHGIHAGRLAAGLACQLGAGGPLVAQGGAAGELRAVDRGQCSAERGRRRADAVRGQGRRRRGRRRGELRRAGLSGWLGTMC